jgi:hypothetical protein
MPIRAKRNWSEYNQKLRKISRVDFYISDDALSDWYYKGPRLAGGKQIYSDHVIELCLLMKEFYSLAYRQTQGFVESIFKLMDYQLSVPE